jgi:hypothetical protein
MEEKKSGRVLAWGGGGGALLALSSLIVTGLVATASGDQSPVADLSPCLVAACSSGSSHSADTTGRPKPASVAHVGRITQSLAASTPPRPAPPSTPAPAAATTVAASTGPTVTVPAHTAPAAWSNSLPAQHLAAPIVATASVKGTSLLMVGADGGVFPVGQAGFLGSLSGKNLSARVAAAAPDPATGGYWLVGRDGGVFAFHASYHGSLTGHRLTAPVVAVAATPSGRGYWLVSSDGGVFAFGDARYAGSLSGARLGSPVVAVSATPSGHGYLLASSDGGVFAFGDAAYHGSSSSAATGSTTAIVATPDGHGYWLAGQSGWVSSFGSARPVTNAVPVIHVAPKPPATVSKASVPGPKRGNAAVPVRAPVLPAGLEHGDAIRAAASTRHETAAGYRSGSVGYDVSQYQCGHMPAGHDGIAVVQVTGGALDNAPNPCYAQEAQWAGPRMSAYIYLDGLPTPAPGPTLSGPAGKCAVTNVACESYNYGWNYVRYWVAYSRDAGVDPMLWGLDVEQYSGWQNTISNQLVIRGALNALSSEGVSGGIYSSPTQWRQITGNLRVPGHPEWVPGAGNLAGPGYSATSFCASPATYSFGGGDLKVVQYGYQGPFPGSFAGPASPYDLDRAC